MGRLATSLDSDMFEVLSGTVACSEEKENKIEVNVGELFVLATCDLH